MKKIRLTNHDRIVCVSKLREEFIKMRYKLYKAGKLWLTMALTIFGVLAISSSVNADVNNNEAGKKLLVQNKNRMMNFLNNSSSGFYVHRKSFLI